MDIGRRFKHFRKVNNLTLMEASKKMGVKYYQLANYETNRSEPSIAILKKMSQTYNISIDALVGNKGINENVPVEEPTNDYLDVDALAAKLNALAKEIKNRGK